MPPILINGQTGEYKLLEEGGMVIGMFPSAEYSRGSAWLKPGDILVCCTDGIVESMDSKDDEFGSERLAASILKNRHRPAQEIVDSVLADVDEFSRDGTHVDDKVLMVVKVSDDGKLSTGKAQK